MLSSRFPRRKFFVFEVRIEQYASHDRIAENMGVWRLLLPRFFLNPSNISRRPCFCV